MNLSIKKAVGAATLLTLLLMFGMAAAPSTFAAGTMAVGGKALIANTDGDNIRVRDGAGSDNKQVAEAHEGETVTVLAGPSKDSKGNAWYKVQAPGGTGWIVSDFLVSKGDATAGAKSPVSNASAKSQAAPATPKLSGYARVANTDGDPLRVRASAGSGGSVVATLDANTLVTVKQGPTVDSDKVSWYQVSANGNTGWVMAQYLAQAQAPAAPAVVAQAPAPLPALAPAPAPASASAPALAPVIQALPAVKVNPPAPVVAPAPAPASAAPVAQPASQVKAATAPAAQPPAQTAGRGSTIVSIAMRYVGYRYRFGGASPSGFDCSGFVYYVLGKIGKNVTHSMSVQYNSGPHVSSKDLQPGDLLFFSNTYKRGLSHAGIYIGNGRFVHAENESTGVTVSELWSSYWAAHYTAAVRP